MSRIFKWIGIVLVLLVVVVLVAGVGLYFSANARLNKIYAVQPAAVSIPSDAPAVEKGAYLYATSCAGCHGDDLGGTRFFNDPALGYFPAPNLSSGQGGIGAVYSDTDFVRAIRHGVAADGRPLMVMPSAAYWYLSNADLGALIAYIRSAAPVDNDLGEKVLQPVGHILLAAGAFGDILTAEVIDHQAARPAAPDQGITVEYGEYLVNTRDCRSCHGPALSGGQSSEPGAPPSPDLTPGGVLVLWSAADFIDTFRTGVTPYGKELDKHFMPYKEYARLTNEDLTAMFLYLQNLPVDNSTAK